jgi:hypothetical protein
MSIAEARITLDGRHYYRVESRNGGPEKLAELLRDGRWRLPDRADLLDAAHFFGNYQFLEKEVNGD